MASHEITKYRLARSPRWPMRTDHVANLAHREPTTLRKQRAAQCERLPGGSLLSKGFGGFNARCYAMAFAFLGIYPRLQRCGCATLRHKSLRSLTASTIVGPLLSAGVAVASSREAGPL